MASSTMKQITGVPTNDFGLTIGTYDFEMSVDALKCEEWGTQDKYADFDLDDFYEKYTYEQLRQRNYYLNKSTAYWLECIEKMGKAIIYHPGYKYCMLRNKRAVKQVEQMLKSVEMEKGKRREFRRLRTELGFNALQIQPCLADLDKEVEDVMDVDFEVIEHYRLSDIIFIMFRLWKHDIGQYTLFKKNNWDERKIDILIQNFRTNVCRKIGIVPNVIRDMECVFGKLQLKSIKPRKANHRVFTTPKTFTVKDFEVGETFVHNGPSDHIIHLLKVIRKKILGMMYERTKFNGRVCSRMHGNMKVKYCVKNNLVCLLPENSLSLTIEHEMDNLDAHGDGEISKDQKSNVVLSNSEGVSKGEPVPLNSLPLWFRWCTSEQVTAYRYLSERYLLVSTIKWSTTDNAGDNLVTYYLPRDVLDGSITKQKMCSVPNVIPFTIHRYWRGDIEIKVQVNSNKFQCGQLQVSWLYATHLDAKVDLRNNVFSLSQTDHALVNAGSSNECVLYIPYKYYKPFLSTKKRDYETTSLVLGRLYIKVLNILRIPKGSPESCHITIFVRYPNSKFVGMIDSSIDSIESTSVEFEMNNITDTALRMLDVMFPANNMDNPPAPRAPMYVVPTASHSWSVGNDISEPLMSLRLGGRGQTPHPFECSKGETRINSLTSKYGLLKIKTWTNEQKDGDLLAKFEASPILSPGEYESKVTEETNLDYYFIPPVGVVSNLFAFWRGTLEFRFDFICTQFHTGRVLAAYIPGVDFYQENVSLKKAKNSPYVVFDLSESHSFTLRVPYIADKPWWPRRYSGNVPEFEEYAPSSIFLYVLNNLVSMSTIAPTIEFNIYMRGGPDFEVSVPVQPCLGLGFNPAFIPYTSAEIVALEGYAPYYAGTYFSFLNSRFLVMRYGTTSGQVALFQSLDARKYFVKISDKTKAPKAIKGLNDKNEAVLVQIEFGVVFNGGGGNNFYLIPFKDANGCKQFCRQIKNGFGPSDWKTDKMFDAKYGTTGNTWSEGNPSWIITAVPPSETVVHFEMENENSPNILDPTNDLLTTGNGKLSFGEHFVDLKDLCRRYQLYGSKTLTSDSYDNSGRATLSFPALPQGLALEIKYEVAQGNTIVALDNEIANRCRDGIIPIVCSAFKYYRGSLRFRIVLPSTDFVNMWVQHRPDYSCKSNTILPFKNITDAANIYNHGYSMYVQNLEVNSIIEFEVPYYMSGMYGVLQTPLPLRFNSKSEINKFYSLGEIVLGLTFGNKKQMENKGMVVQIFYSFGDDMALNTYQGFPPMVFLDDVREKPKPKAILNTSECGSEYECVFEHEMWNVGKAIKKILRPTIDELKEESAASIETMSDNITSTIKEAAQNVNESVVTETKENFIASAIGEIGHCILNPSLKTFMWSIVSFLCKLGILTYKLLQSSYNLFVNVFTKIFRKINPKEVDLPTLVKEEVTPTEQVSGDGPTTVKHDGFIKLDFEGPMGLDCEDIAKVCSLIFSGVSTICCVKVDRSKGEDYAPLLMKNVSSGARLFNNLCILFKNIGGVLKKMFNYCVNLIRPEVSLCNTLCDDIPDIKAWAENVQQICDMSVRTLILTNPDLRQEVEDLYVFGTILVTSIVDTTFAGGATIRFLADKISALRDELLAGGSSPYVRKEPYCLWISGPPGIGKSTNATGLVSKMLKKVSYKTNKELILTVSPTSKHWNNCDHQPCLYVDDMFAVTTPESLDQQLNMMFMVKSSAVLNPPMAEVKDKKIRYNPEIFLISSNLDFPVINEMKVPSAVYRRRDCLVRMAWAPFYIDSKGIKKEINSTKISENKVTIKDYPDYVIKQKAHCVYYIARDPIDPKTVWNGPFDHNVFQDWVSNDFSKYYVKEAELFRERVNETFSLLHNSDEARDFTYEKITNRFEVATIAIREKIAQRDKALIDCITDEVQNKKNALVEKIKEKWNQFSIPIPKFLKGDNRVSFASNVQKGIKKSASAFNIKVEADFTDVTDEENPSASCSKDRVSEEDFRDMAYKVASGDDRVVKILIENECLTKDDDYSIMTTYYQALDHNFVFGNRIENIKAIYMMFYCNYVRVNECNTTGCAHVKLFEMRCDIFYCNIKKKFKNVNGFEVSEEPCEGDCIAKNDLLWKLYCEFIVRKSLTGRIYLNRRKYHMLPKCMGEDNAISLNILQKLFRELEYWKLYLQDCYVKYVGPKVRMIINFFEKHYEKMWWGILGTIGVAYALMMCKVSVDVMRYDFNDLSKLELENEMVNSGDIGVKNVVKKDFVCERKVLTELDNPQVNAMCRKIDNNTVYIVCKFNERVVSARCLGLKSKAVLILRHYLEEFDYIKKKYGDKCSFYVQYQPKQNESVERLIPVTLENLKVQYFSNSNDNNQTNFGVLYLSERFAEFKDITSYFIPYAATKNINSRVVLFEVGKTFHSNLLMKRLKVKIESEEHYTPINLITGYSYGTHGKGMCGSVLLDENNSQHPIIGIHVGGANGLGVSEPVYREMFDGLKVNVVDTVTIDMLDKVSEKATLTSNIIPLGVVESSLAKHESGISRIVPSEIHGVFDIRTQPAPLSKSDPRLIEKISPMLAGCDKHGLPSAMFPSDLLNECMNDLKELMFSKCVPVRAKVGKVCLNDVIMGNPDIPHFDALNWNTSEGFPFTTYRPRNSENKKWLFNFSGEGADIKLEGLHKKLYDVMKEKDEQRSKRVLPCTIFTDCLKDTRLTLEKIPIPGKTRIFSISPVDFTIQFKQYYLDFMASYMKNRFDLEHMIGMNVDGYEWDMLRQRLLNKGNAILTGDYSNFGPGLNSEVAGACFKIIKEWYKYHGADEEHLKHMDMMAHELIAAKHLCFDFVYSVPCGLPSGSPITTPLNSLVNCLYVRLMWKLIMKECKDPKLIESDNKFNSNNTCDSFVNYYKHTQLYTYGDDLIMSVSSEILPYFNNITLSNTFKKYGIKYTDSTKSDTISHSCAIADATFLKRRFIKHPKRNIFVAALDKVSVEDCANWIWARGVDKHEASLVNSSMSCDLSFGWGPEYHVFVSNRIKEYWRRKNVHFVCKSYEDLDYERFVMSSNEKVQAGFYLL